MQTPLVDPTSIAPVHEDINKTHLSSTALFNWEGSSSICPLSPFRSLLGWSSEAVAADSLEWRSVIWAVAYALF